VKTLFEKLYRAALSNPFVTCGKNKDIIVQPFRHMWQKQSVSRTVQANLPDSGSVLGLSQFSILPQLPPKIMLYSKVVTIDPKIIIACFDNINS
jgi:hypothetical protein